MEEEQISNVRRVDFKAKKSADTKPSGQADVISFKQMAAKKEEKELAGKMTAAATQFMSYIVNTIERYDITNDSLSKEEALDYIQKVRNDFRYLFETNRAYELMFVNTLKEYPDWDIFSMALHAVVVTDEGFTALQEDVMTLFEEPKGSQVWVFIGEGHDKDFRYDDPIIFDSREAFQHFLTDDSNLSPEQKQIYDKLKKDFEEFISKDKE